MLGSMLSAPSASTTTASSPTASTSDNFVETVVKSNMAQVDDLARNAAKVPAREYWWPVGTKDFHAMFPELRQLCNWGMMMGENSSAASSASPLTPTTDVGPCLGPEDFVPQIDLAVDDDSLTTKPPSSERRPDQSHAEKEPDNSVLLQLPLQAGPALTLTPATHQDSSDAVLLMQLLVNHSDVEHEHVTTDPATNIEIAATPSAIVEVVQNTLGELWERGDEMVAQNLAMHFVQLSGQAHPCHPAHHFLVRLYRTSRGYAQRGSAPIFLTPAWQDWVDATTQLALQQVREDRDRWQNRLLSYDNVNNGIRGDNVNNLPHLQDDAEAETLVPDDDAVALVTRPGRVKTHGRRPPRPQSRAAEMAPTASLSESWVGVTPGTTPAPEMHSTASSAPWRRERSRSAPTRRTSTPATRPVAKSPGSKAKPAPTPGAEPATSRPGTTEVRDPDARASTDHRASTVTDVSSDEREFNADLPQEAANMWRPLLGLRSPQCPADDEGGLLPHQRTPIARLLLRADAHERVRMLAMLQFYLATVCQEISALMESVSRRELAAQAGGGDEPGDDRPEPGVGDSLGDADEALAPEADESEMGADDPLEEVADDEDEDDNFISMQLSSTCRTPPSSNRPLSPTLTFAMTLEALSSATLEIPTSARPSLCAWIMQRARRQCGGAPDLHLTLLEAALGCPTDTGTVADALAIAAWNAWLQRWWGILGSHLPHAAEPIADEGGPPPSSVNASEPPLHQALVEYDSDSDSDCVVTVADGDYQQNVEEPPPVPAADGGNLEMLVTVASSVDEVSSRLEPVRIPVGECVAVTLLASITANVRNEHASSMLRPVEHADLRTPWPSVPVQLARHRAARRASPLVGDHRRSSGSDPPMTMLHSEDDVAAAVQPDRSLVDDGQPSPAVPHGCVPLHAALCDHDCGLPSALPGPMTTTPSPTTTTTMPGPSITQWEEYVRMRQARCVQEGKPNSMEGLNVP